MRSTHPIARVVIDTSVHFGLPDEAPDNEGNRNHGGRCAIASPASNSPETSSKSIHKPSKPRSSSFARYDRTSRRAKSAIHVRQQHLKPRSSEDPEDLSPDEYKPWDSDANVNSSGEHEILAPPSDARSEAQLSSSTPSSHADISTIDKKKLQLQALRSSMRVRFSWIRSGLAFVG